jgi:hypothetical protein
MLSVQESPQEPHTLIVALQTQVSLQHQLLSAQATLARQDELLARAWTTPPQGDGMPLASLTAPPAVAQAPMIIGGAQPAGYVYIGSSRGQAIWGQANIVQGGPGPVMIRLSRYE